MSRTNTSSEIDWLLAEYEFLWTSQSDINGRIVTVYTQSISVAMALLVAIGIWSLGAAKDANTSDVLLRALLFALPIAVVLVAFQHNIGQRRSIVHIAGYWKALIDVPARRLTWASRMDAYRRVLRENEEFRPLTGEANDPVALAYWVVYGATVTLAAATVAACTPAVRYSFALYAFIALAIPGVALAWLTHAWRSVLKVDYPLMAAAWERVRSSESEVQSEA
jgi:hypothetical protein